MIETQLNVIREMDIRRFLQNTTSIDTEKYLSLCELVKKSFDGKFIELLYKLITSGTSNYNLLGDLPFDPDFPNHEEVYSQIKQIQKLITNENIEHELLFYDVRDRDEERDFLSRQVGVLEYVMGEIGEENISSSELLELYLELIRFLEVFEREYIRSQLTDKDTAVILIINKVNTLELVLCS